MTTDQSTGRGNVVEAESSPTSNDILPDSDFVNVPAESSQTSDGTLPEPSIPAESYESFKDKIDNILFLVDEYKLMGDSLVLMGDSLVRRNEELKKVARKAELMASRWTQKESDKIRPCKRCPKLERKIRTQNSLIRRLADFSTTIMQFVPQDHASYVGSLKELNELKNLVSPRVKPVIRSSDSVVLSGFRRDEPVATVVSPAKRKSLTDEAVTSRPPKSAHPSDEAVTNTVAHANKSHPPDESVIVKSPERPSPELSPIVERSRMNRRRMKLVSTKKRNKLEKGEDMANVDSDSDFTDFDVISYPSANGAETPDVVDVHNCVAPLVTNHITTPITTPTTTELSQSSNEDIIEPTQKMPSRRRTGIHGRRSLVFDKPNLNDATIEQQPEERVRSGSEKTSPLNVIITSSNSGLTSGSAVSKSPNKQKKANKSNEVEDSVFRNPAKTHADEKKSQETKWSLAPSRQPTTSKFKQTVLTMAPVPKKTDLSKQEKFTGGLLRAPDPKKTEGVDVSFSKKVSDESSVPTFESAVTSTANDFVFKTPMKSEKSGKFAKYANKVADSSFDVIPAKTGPKYKYQGDAVRKKDERRKLPGQKADCCATYYGAVAKDRGETHANELMDKFSRHRHNHPNECNTPPGLWNPVFDTNDEMLMHSRQ